MSQAATSNNQSGNSTSGRIARVGGITLNSRYIWSVIVLAVLIVFATGVWARSNQSNSIDLGIDGGSEQSSLNLSELLPEAAQNASNARAHVDINLSTNNSDGSSNAPSVEVEVNGQEIPIPESGQVTETVEGSEEEGTIHVNVQSTSSNADGDDRTRIRIDSETESEVRIRSDD